MRLASLVVLLAACHPHESAPQDPEAPKRQVIERAIHHLDAPPAALPHHEYTRLLDAGAGPKQPLRYLLAPGTTTAHISSHVRSRSFAEHAWSAWTDAPSTADGVALTVAGDPRRPLAIRMTNRVLFATLDDRGQLGPVSFGDGPGETTDATQRLLALVVQLPAEPVGIGATWRAVDVLRQRPAIVKQTATYTLLARTETTLRLGVEIVRNGQPQTVSDPALPAGTDAELQTLHRTLTGTIEIDLTRPVPTATLALDARLHIKLAPARGAVQEQMFEDTGTVGVAL